MYKSSDVRVRVDTDPRDDATVTTASLGFHSKVKTTAIQVDTAKFDSLREAEIEARHGLHYVLYGDVADELDNLHKLALDMATAGKALGSATWHHADFGDVHRKFEDAHKAYIAAYDSLMDKLRNHP